MSSGTVPVMPGSPRENYECFLPLDSFTHLDDFTSAEDLAWYLWELSEDAGRYQRCFQWRKWLSPVGWSRGALQSLSLLADDGGAVPGCVPPVRAVRVAAVCSALRCPASFAPRWRDVVVELGGNGGRGGALR